MTGTIIYALILVGLCYFYALNLFLRGRLKPIIEGILVLLCMGMLVASFFIFNWKTGIGMILLALISVPVMKALATPVAYRLLGYRTGYNDSSSTETDSQRFMSGQLSVEQYFADVGKREEKTKATLAHLAQRPGIERVLRDNAITKDGYLELYWDLMKHALPDLAWDILGDPERLQKLIDLKRNGAPSHIISATFREYR